MGLAAQQNLIKKNNLITITSLNDRITTLPEILKSNGYQTFAITANPNISKIMGLHQGFDLIISPNQKSANAITKKCLQLIKKFDNDKPYFLYIHFMDTHSPYKIELPDNLLTNDPISNRIKIYDLEIAFVDSQIKKIFNYLNWSKNTLIIITADHGEEFFEHGKIGHGYSLYKEVLNIPLIIYYPNIIPKNEKYYANVSNIDIFPTIINILNLKPTNAIYGKSLLPIIKNKNKYANQRYIFSHLISPKYFLKSSKIISIIHKNYHYIHYPKKKLVFDLSLDPNEKNNIAARKVSLTKHLYYKYKIFEKKANKFPPSYNSVALDNDQINLLKSLGYIK